jgi:hypothetical protein
MADPSARGSRIQTELVPLTDTMFAALPPEAVRAVYDTRVAAWEAGTRILTKLCVPAVSVREVISKANSVYWEIVRMMSVRYAAFGWEIWIGTEPEANGLMTAALAL